MGGNQMKVQEYKDPDSPLIIWKIFSHFGYSDSPFITMDKVNITADGDPKFFCNVEGTL